MNLSYTERKLLVSQHWGSGELSVSAVEWKRTRYVGDRTIHEIAIMVGYKNKELMYIYENHSPVVTVINVNNFNIEYVLNFSEDVQKLDIKNVDDGKEFVNIILTMDEDIYNDRSHFEALNKRCIECSREEFINSLYNISHLLYGVGIDNLSKDDYIAKELYDVSKSLLNSKDGLAIVMFDCGSSVYECKFIKVLELLIKIDDKSVSVGHIGSSKFICKGIGDIKALRGFEADNFDDVDKVAELTSRILEELWNEENIEKAGISLMAMKYNQV